MHRSRLSNEKETVQRSRNRQREERGTRDMSTGLSL